VLVLVFQFLKLEINKQLKISNVIFYLQPRLLIGFSVPFEGDEVGHQFWYKKWHVAHLTLYTSGSQTVVRVPLEQGLQSLGTFAYLKRYIQG